MRDYLDEIARDNLGTVEIGITGGEAFMNPDIIPLPARYGDKMTLRISVDHFNKAMHEQERGAKTWELRVSR